MNEPAKSLQEALEAFDFGGDILGLRPYGKGHINDTFLVETDGSRNYILQRISSAAFKNPAQVMSNIIGITEYLAKRIEREGGERSREALEVVRPRSGEDFYTDSQGGAWRAFVFIADSVCHESAENEEVFQEAGRAFGRFQRLLEGYPAQTLFETIPGFHDTEDRLAKLKCAVAEDAFKRAESVRAEIDFALQREADCSVVLRAQREGKLPLRVSHNDTKLTNVLMDAKSGRGLCVIDLDTTMPGLMVNDFGDAIRYGANRAGEGERDIEKVRFDLGLYRAYARGFLEGAGGIFSDGEIEYMPWGARLMTLECGIRFLTDYLQGDVYFKTSYEGQNLDRCRSQFKLVSDMERQFEDMARVTAQLAK